MSISEIKFKLNTKGNAVFAHYSLHKPNLLEIDKDWVLSQLKNNGMQNFVIDKENITQLISIVNNAENGSGKIQVAECLDAQVIIDAKDDMTAYMSIEHAQGGKPVCLEMVKKALAAKGIRHGFLLDDIRVAIVTGEANNLLVVRAEPAKDGKDAQFVCTLPEIKIRTPRIAEHGNVNYRDLGDITVVERGEIIMRRLPATIGTPSKNIFGRTLTPKPGIDTPYSKKLKGVIISKEDPDILIAGETGQPIIMENGITIENTMSIKKVDLSTGNIVFEGSVIVIGDVASNMLVQAKGDITVKGMVENATLDAGGNILIRGAVIGHSGDIRSDSDNANLKANGSITAKFTENANLKSNDNIYIQDWSLKSNMSAINEIVVGNQNSSKGQIIGGKVTSGILVKVKNLGSSAGVKTYIEVGNEADLKLDLDSLSGKCFKQEQLLKEIHKNIASLKNNPTSQAAKMLEEAKYTYTAVEKSIVAIQQEQELLKLERTRTKNAKIVVEKNIYAGTTVVVIGKKKSFKEDAGRRTITIKDQELTHIFH